MELSPRTMDGKHTEQNVLFIYSLVDWNVVDMIQVSFSLDRKGVGVK